MRLRTMKHFSPEWNHIQYPFLIAILNEEFSHSCHWNVFLANKFMFCCLTHPMQAHLFFVNGTVNMRVEIFLAVHCMKWAAKPRILSPLMCARYGWINVGCDMLKCSSCQAFLSASLQPTLDIDKCKQNSKPLTFSSVATVGWDFFWSY